MLYQVTPTLAYLARIELSDDHPEGPLGTVFRLDGEPGRERWKDLYRGRIAAWADVQRDAWSEARIEALRVRRDADRPPPKVHLPDDGQGDLFA